MIHIDPLKTASFDVDPQCGFTPICPKELPIEEGDFIAEELNKQAQFARYRIVSKDCHPAQAPWITDEPDQVMQPVEGNYKNLDIKWPAHCVVGTLGNTLIPGLPEEKDYDLVIEKGNDPLKHPYGACYHDLAEAESTGAIEWLQQHHISTVIVGGLATDFCVKTTVLQLRKAGIQVVLNLAACRGVAQESTQVACELMREHQVLLLSNSTQLHLK